MQILFLHNNFPAQFGALGGFLARRGWDVWFGTQRKGVAANGLKVFAYEPHRKVSDKTHPYAANFENAVLNAQATARAALRLKTKGLNPDIVVAHSGWGPGLFAKDLWPDAKYVGYFEWYYRSDAPDVAFFDADRSMDDQLRARARSAAILMDLASCDAGICPTRFQYDQFPECFQPKLNVLHDGVDVEACKPNPDVRFTLDDIELSRATEIVTYVACGMEPYRGFPQFMKACEIILAERPNAHVVIVGEDRVAYGKKLNGGDSYKKRALRELSIDPARLHFTGLLPRAKYIEVLQASTVHVYLTAPFVLSWSMMEAMSAECAIVASDTAPVRELIDQEVHGVLTDIADPDAIAASVTALLDDEARRRRLGAAARARIVEAYEAQTLMERHEALFESLASVS